MQKNNALRYRPLHYGANYTVKYAHQIGRICNLLLLSLVPKPNATLTFFPIYFDGSVAIVVFLTHVVRL